jgi:hypothetical protein
MPILISALCSVNGFKPPKVGSGVLIGGDITQPEMKSVAVELQNLGYKLYCSNSGVESFLNSIPYVVSPFMLLKSRHSLTLLYLSFRSLPRRSSSLPKIRES